MAKGRKIILCDTNVFFEYYRENPLVIEELDLFDVENLYLSAVTVGEIYYGMKSSEKRRTVELVNQFNVLHLDKAISLKTISLILAYPARRVALPDAMIAATALTHKAELFTFNRKDFNYIEGIQLYNPTQKLP